MSALPITFTETRLQQLPAQFKRQPFRTHQQPANPWRAALTDGQGWVWVYGVAPFLSAAYSQVYQCKTPSSGSPLFSNHIILGIKQQTEGPFRKGLEKVVRHKREVEEDRLDPSVMQGTCSQAALRIPFTKPTSFRCIRR